MTKPTPWKYNVWNNGYALRSRDGWWASAKPFDTEEEALAYLDRVCIQRQAHLPKHLHCNYEVKRVRVPTERGDHEREDVLRGGDRQQ